MAQSGLLYCCGTERGLLYCCDTERGLVYCCGTERGLLYCCGTERSTVLLWHRARSTVLPWHRARSTVLLWHRAVYCTAAAKSVAGAGLVQLQLNEAQCNVLWGQQINYLQQKSISSRKIYFLSCQYTHTVAVSNNTVAVSNISAVQLMSQLITI